MHTRLAYIILWDNMTYVIEKIEATTIRTTISNNGRSSIKEPFSAPAWDELNALAEDSLPPGEYIHYVINNTT